MGFPNESSSAGYITDSVKGVSKDVYSMDAVVSELEMQVNRLKDLELAMTQRLVPVIKTNPHPDLASPSYPADVPPMTVPPMTNRATFVYEQTTLLREWINRIYELLDSVDA